MSEILIPPFDTKVAVVVNDDLLTWQRLNVTAFLSAGIAAASPQLIGEPYRDADDQTYLALLGMPILVFEADGPTLTQILARAQRRGLTVALYTRDMFKTGYDEQNRAAVADIHTDDLDIVGIALHGPKNGVDKTVKGARLHP